MARTDLPSSMQPFTSMAAAARGSPLSLPLFFRERNYGSPINITKVQTPTRADASDFVPLPFTPNTTK